LATPLEGVEKDKHYNPATPPADGSTEFTLLNSPVFLSLFPGVTSYDNWLVQYADNAAAEKFVHDMAAETAYTSNSVNEFLGLLGRAIAFAQALSVNYPGS